MWESVNFLGCYVIITSTWRYLHPRSFNVVDFFLIFLSITVHCYSQVWAWLLTPVYATSVQKCSLVLFDSTWEVLPGLCSRQVHKWQTLLMSVTANFSYQPCEAGIKEERWEKSYIEELLLGSEG